MKALQYAVVLGVCALMFVGCRSMTGRSFGQQWDDKTITAHVKSRLIHERFGNMFSTGVGTQFGVVHLTGTVPTEAERMEAERIAGRVAGVREVRNDIMVVPRHAQTAKAADGGGPAGTPAASPTAAGPLAISGQVTAVDRNTGDVTVRTQTGDVTLRLPPAALREVEQGQRLSISAGQ